MTIKKYFRVWYLSTAATVMGDLSRRFSSVFLILGKGARIVFFAVFLFILLSGKRSLAGYSLPQAMIFYLTFNLIDTLAQLFLRGAYFFRSLVIKGDLDLVLTRPLNPLFSVLFSHTDILDFILFWPLLLTLLYAFSFLPSLSFVSYVLYFLLVGNGLLIAAAFHILVLALAITTYEVDNALMIYRDLSSLGRVPVDLYREPLRFLVTFVLPIGIMISFPVKALLGLLEGPVMAFSLVVSTGFFLFSLIVWDRSLRFYSSASS